MDPRRWDEDETNVLLQAWWCVADDHSGREEPLPGGEVNARILQRFVELSQEHMPPVALSRSANSARCKCESLVKMTTIVAAYNCDAARNTRRSGNARRHSKRQRTDDESSDDGRDWFALSVSEKRGRFVRVNGRASNYSEVNRSMFQMIRELMKRDKLRVAINPEMNSTSNGIDATLEKVTNDSKSTSANENDQLARLLRLLQRVKRAGNWMTVEIQRCQRIEGDRPRILLAEKQKERALCQWRIGAKRERLLLVTRQALYKLNFIRLSRFQWVVPHGAFLERAIGTRVRVVTRAPQDHIIVPDVIIAELEAIVELTRQDFILSTLFHGDTLAPRHAAIGAIGELARVAMESLLALTNAGLVAAVPSSGAFLQLMDAVNTRDHAPRFPFGTDDARAIVACETIVAVAHLVSIAHASPRARVRAKRMRRATQTECEQ
ncbi:hypothetical protein FI667_g5122, partial [Globisporangium splendens]